MFKGIAASPGIVIGKAYLYNKTEINIDYNQVEDTDNEINVFKNAKLKTKEQIEQLYKRTLETMGEDEADIFKAHIMVLEDPMLDEKVIQNIQNKKLNARAALYNAVTEIYQVFNNIDDEYMRERALDIKDVGQRLLYNIAGVNITSLSDLHEEVIVISDDLTPSDTAGMDIKKVKGFATDFGGSTSHTAIMARSLEIPAVLGLNDISIQVKSGDSVIVDGNTGTVIVNPTKEQLAEYIKNKSDYDKEKKEMEKLKDLPAVTKDCRRVEISANIGTPDDVEGVFKYGAEGIGLFRTEFLYMNRHTMPTEDEQYEKYRQVVQSMGDKPVIIRTLDIGGDKELPYFNFQKELNPFLGWRAIRICLDRVDIFKTQLRAILRASNYGNLKIMYPMISGITEIRKANKILNEVKKELNDKGIPYKRDLEVGIMIEIPSAAVMADLLANEVDFFSIGTNDLTQYTLAVDRGNEKISKLYDSMHPAVLRLIKHVIRSSHEARKWTGMCGELAGNPTAAVILLGLGLDEFSMSASSVPSVKKVIRNMTYKDAMKIANTAINLSTGDEVREYVKSKI